MKTTVVLAMLDTIKKSASVMTEEKLIRLIEKFIEKLKEHESDF